MSAPRILIYILRRDLRLSDNPVFHEISRIHASKAEAHFTHLLPIYVFSAKQIEVSGFLKTPHDGAPAKSPYPEAKSATGGFLRCGPHRAKFLAQSVWDLKVLLQQVGSDLSIRCGMLPEVVRLALDHFDSKNASNDPKSDVKARGEVVGVWMTEEETTEEAKDQRLIRKLVEARGKEFKLFADEKYYLDDRDLPFERIQDLPDVYTTFRKSVEPLRSRPRLPLPKPKSLPPLPPSDSIPPPRSEFSTPETLEDLVSAVLRPIDPSLGLSKPPQWPESRGNALDHSAHPFDGGETAALDRVDHLITTGAMASYKDTRNGLLGKDFSTKLSGYLAHGCLTARQIHRAMAVYEDGTTEDEEYKKFLETYKSAPGFGEGENAGTAGVRFELLWRDYMRLCARKFGSKLFAIEGQRGAYDKQWKKMQTTHYDEEKCDVGKTLDRFLSGRTGISFIDASARELYHSGYSSNRARQNVANFLAKHLDIDWRLGAEWYECMLVDYDAASNWGNWQYVSGVGNDPREGRIFNPVKQALDYDSKGEYIKTWIPELENIDPFNEDGTADEEKLMGLFQPWRLDEATKKELGLADLDFVEDPLAKIPFSIGKKPRTNPRGRGNFRRGGGRRFGRWRGRGGGRDTGAEPSAGSGPAQ